MKTYEVNWNFQIDGIAYVDIDDETLTLAEIEDLVINTFLQSCESEVDDEVRIALQTPGIYIEVTDVCHVDADDYL